MHRSLLVIVGLVGMLVSGEAHASTVFNANSSQMGHLIGAAASATSWAVTSTSPPGVLTYGPYTTQFQDGAYRAGFSLKVDNNTADDQTIGALDVYDGVTQTVLARREFHRKDFAAAGVAQRFDVTFVTRGANRLEFRVFYVGASYLEHLSTTLDSISNLADSAQYTGVDSRLFHQIGNAGPGASWEVASTAGAGVLTYGPYTAQFTAGNYRAVFSLLTDNTTADDLEIATIDVLESGTRVLASRTLTRHAFAAPLVAQTFEVAFSYAGTGPLEFRVKVAGHAYVRHISTTVVHATALSWNGNDPALGHQLGAASGTAWSVPSSAGAGYLSYGPYTTSVPVGPATATFTLREDNNTADNNLVARIEAYDAATGEILSSRLIRRRNFWTAGAAQTFDLVFELARPARLELRVFVYGAAHVDHLSTAVTPDRVSLTSLWNGATHFEFRKRDVFTGGEGATASLVVLDGIWYAFNRQSFTRTGCPGNVGIRSIVRQSFDHGQTWSSPVTIVEPNANLAASDGCYVVDGSGFYDADTDTWHYLTQCIGSATPWMMCHYTRAGMLPMGPFTPDAANPVVHSGQLFRAICAGAGKHCPATTVDEGTPQILAKTNGQFVVTFHGANYGPVINGYRGVATTADFHTWQTTGAGLPGDALMSPVECNPWGGWGTGGCIGVGAARLLRSDGYNYVLTEAADVSLGCTAGQHWTFGLLRNSILGASGTWTNYPSNAYIENQNVSTVGCALQYMNVVRDRGEIYLVFGLFTPEYGFPNYTYQLVSGPGPAKLLVH